MNLFLYIASMIYCMAMVAIMYPVMNRLHKQRKSSGGKYTQFHYCVSASYTLFIIALMSIALNGILKHEQYPGISAIFFMVISTGLALIAGIIHLRNRSLLREQLVVLELWESERLKQKR